MVKFVTNPHAPDLIALYYSNDDVNRDNKTTINPFKKYII